MRKTPPLTLDPHLLNKLTSFVNEYGASGLDEALDTYTKMQSEYICRTKTGISKIHICDINYIEVSGHHLAVHTEHGIFSKYGTLTNELKCLSSYGFIRCSQKHIVALSKIKSVSVDSIIMTDNTEIHMSRGCIPKVITAFAMR